MKPLLLTFGGFGAFPGEVSIDFTQLDELGLFLVVGKTGAGKSTIFDAMTFALYGRPANGRSASVLVSDHKDRVKPHVEFEFALGSRRFRVSRVLDVGSTAAAPGKQKFEVLDPSGKTVSAVTGKTTVTAEVQHLLGLDADQFFKVVMIPQGDFQEFLIANDLEKEKLLKALFGTALYGSIAQKLVDQAAIKVSAVEESRSEQIRLRMDARNAVEDIPDEISIDLWPDPDEDLPGVITSVKRAAELASIEATRLDEEWKEAHASFTTANAEADRFHDSATLVELKKQQSAGAKAVVIAEKELEAHKSAEVLVPHIETLAEKQVQLTEAETVLADAQKALKKLFGASLIGAPVFAELRGHGVDTPPATLLRVIERASGKLDNAEEFIEKIADAQGDKKLHQANLVKVEGAIKDATARKKTLEARRPKLELKLKDTRTLANKYEGLELKVESLEKQLDDADVETALAKADAKEKALAAAVKRQEEAKLSYDVAMAKKTLFLAGELADSLIDGEACPVCGSEEHPAPAKPGGGY
ncbi:MAG: SMC family ATPase, partial [Actinomycetes bacterium]